MISEGTKGIPTANQFTNETFTLYYIFYTGRSTFNTPTLYLYHLMPYKVFPIRSHSLFEQLLPLNIHPFWFLVIYLQYPWESVCEKVNKIK